MSDAIRQKIGILETDARGHYNLAVSATKEAVSEGRGMTEAENLKYAGHVEDYQKMMDEANVLAETLKKSSIVYQASERILSAEPKDIENINGVNVKGVNMVWERKSIERKRYSFNPDHTQNQMLHFICKNMPSMSNIPAEFKDLTRLSGVDGGFLISEEFLQTIQQALFDLTFMRGVATVINTSASSVSMPSWDFDESVPKRADNQAVAVDTITNAVGKLLFTPNSFGSIVKIPAELLEDAGFDLFSFLAMRLAERWAELEEAHYIGGDSSGSGVNEPLGLLNSGLTAVDVDTSTSAAIVADDVNDLPYQIKAAYRRNARFLMNRTYVQKVRALRTEDGGAGLGNFLWQPSFQAGEPSTLIGWPLMETEFWPTVSSDGDPVMVFGDFSKYWIVDRAGGGDIQRLNELYAANNQVGLKFTIRTDGAVVDTNAFIRLNRT